jgi:histone-lysine N-methyltransferase SETMAR
MVKYMIGDHKMMVAIVWNLQCFHLVDALPKGQKFHANSDINIIMQRVSESRSSGLGPGLIIHAKTTRPYTAQKTLRFRQENRLEMAPHPLYSPDLAPSDFFLFEHVRHVLRGRISIGGDSSSHNSVNNVGSEDQHIKGGFRQLG